MKIKSKKRRIIYMTLIGLFLIGLLPFIPHSFNLFTDGTRLMNEHKAIETTAQSKLNRLQVESDEGGEDIEERAVSFELNTVAFVDVSVATLWTEPNLNRSIDEASIGNPVDMWEWTENMTTDEKKGLIGNLQTQALYGDAVTIMELMDEWAKVAVHGQPTPESNLGYVAWMPTGQLIYDSMDKSFVAENPFAVVTSPTTRLFSDKQMQIPFLEVSYNTRLPVVKQVGDKVLVATPGDGTKWIAMDSVAIYNPGEEIPIPTGDVLVQSGKQFLGLPYLWAGTSGFGFDCSGFTYSIYKANGIIIPRDSSVQATHGAAVEKEDLRKGDLLFFADNNGEGFVHHVGMYIGDGEIIHAPNSDSTVEVINVFESDYWSNEYSGARRYID